MTSPLTEFGDYALQLPYSYSWWRLVACGAAITLVIYSVAVRPWLSRTRSNAAKLSDVDESEKASHVSDFVDKDLIVFFGSQTGTAEDYSRRLAKEGQSRFGLRSLIVDLETFEAARLEVFPSDKIAVFVMATYGEGEPPDNAVNFYEKVVAKSELSQTSLSQLKYAAFGLGNNTYEHYNHVVRTLDASLMAQGARRVGPRGEGDDGPGTTEDDYLAWKEQMWAALAAELNLKERTMVEESSFKVTEKGKMEDIKHTTVYLGEHSWEQLEGIANTEHNAKTPFMAPIVESVELFKVQDRNCLHMEINIEGSGLHYQTGDHVAVWPSNADAHVDHSLDIFNLSDRRDVIIEVQSLDTSVATVPFPTPTTYETALRYYLEICAPVSRQFMSCIAHYAPDEPSRAYCDRLSKDAELFRERVSSRHLTLAQITSAIHKGPWHVPFAVLLEGLNRIQPRYYSISSSSLVQPQKLSLTAVVESADIVTEESTHTFKGVATNYLLAIKELQHGRRPSALGGLTYSVHGPRNRYKDLRIPIHIRQSSFRLPSDPTQPIIMIGPGTGVAPFRGFIQERAEQKRRGLEVGQSLLFYGCRRPSEDWLYQDEWEAYKHILGNKLTIYNAFSRETSQKVYVQHHLEARADEVNALLLRNAFFYVCGDAGHMAKAVQQVLTKIVSKQRCLSLSDSERLLRQMRDTGLYQEDVWG